MQRIPPISEAERLFHDEVREKKKTASGVHHKTGRNGFVGNMRFPSDIMNRKDKMRYRRASKCMTTNLFDTIIPIAEFEALETYEQRNRMQYWRTEKTNKDILKGMGISSKKYYEIVKELDLPKAPRTETKKTPRKATAKKPEAPVVKKEVVGGVPEVVQDQKSQVQEIIIDGLNLVFIGTYKAEVIQKQFKKFIALLDEEPDDFHLELRIMQKQPK